MINNLERLFCKISLIIVFAGLLFSPLTVAGQSVENLTGESGQTWITWTWDLNDSDFAYVYQDGVYITESSLGNYTISTNPNEKHVLTLIANNSTHPYTSEIFSKKQSFEGNLIYIFIISSFFLILGLRFPLFSLIATPFYIYGGIIALNQTSESWIILAFWLSGGFSLIEFSFLMKKE